jgi:hypothetical protein
MSKKINYSDFINTNQFIIDEINSSIKIEKEKIKKPLLFLEHLEKFLFQITKSELQRKLLKYQKILNETKDFSFTTKIGFFEIPGYDYKIVSEDNNNSKVSLLTQITDILEELLITYNDSKEKELRNLEYSFNFLYRNNNQSASIHELADLFFDITELKEFVLSPLNKLKSRLQFYFKSKNKSACIDIRQSYRRIIHFLFKNMDDESGNDNNLFVTNLKQFITSSIIDHVQLLRFRSIKKYTKYKYTINIGTKRSLASSYY